VIAEATEQKLWLVVGQCGDGKSTLINAPTTSSLAAPGEYAPKLLRVATIDGKRAAKGMKWSDATAALIN
jgi:predicted ATPase